VESAGYSLTARSCRPAALAPGTGATKLRDHARQSRERQGAADARSPPIRYTAVRRGCAGRDQLPASAAAFMAEQCSAGLADPTLRRPRRWCWENDRGKWRMITAADVGARVVVVNPVDESERRGWATTGTCSQYCVRNRLNRMPHLLCRRNNSDAARRRKGYH